MHRFDSVGRIPVCGGARILARVLGKATMIDRIIELSLRNKFLVALLWIGIAGWGLWAMLPAPIDAIPDLSDTQVIVFTDWSGRSPQEVEDQSIDPLTANLHCLP